MTITRPRSVLLVSNFLSGGRATRCYSADVAAHLGDAGWTVFTTSSVQSPLLRPADMLRTILGNRHRYAVAQVEVYSGRAFAWAELAALGLRVSKKPYVLSLRGGNLPQFARQWPDRARRLLRSAHAVIVPSSFLLEEMRPYRDDLTLVPNSLDVERYAYRTRERAAGSLVWMRAFHAIYNPALAVRLMAILLREFPQVRLRMIGPDMRDGSLQATARLAGEMGIGHAVSFHGPVPKSEVGDWLGQADIYLNTPDVDNAPISVLEALACGLCVVSTDAGGLRYLLHHGHDALLVPPGDPHALAAAIRRTLLNPALVSQLSRNGRRTAEQFGWSRVLPLWERVLMTAAENPSVQRV